MSFLKKLFGGGSKPAATESPAVEHNGFLIRATPYQENGQWQMCGIIEKQIGGEMKSHRFVRADRFPGEFEARDFSISKAKQIIDQMGDTLFNGR